MSKINIFLMLSGYQLTLVNVRLWRAMLYNSFIPGLICGLFFLAICFVNSENKKKTSLVVFLISFNGLSIRFNLWFFLKFIILKPLYMLVCYQYG